MNTSFSPYHIPSTLNLSGSALPVLIIGAGPTGLTLALDLHRRGVPYRLLEKLETPMQFSKANTLMSRTLEEFVRLGVTDEMLTAGLPLSKGVIFQKGRKRSEFVADLPETAMPFLLNLRQNQLEDILRHKLASVGGVVETGWELLDFEQFGNKVVAHFSRANGEKRTLEGQYLIGTDGAHSRVRKGLGLPLEGITYPDSFLVTDIHTDLDLGRDASYSWLHKDGFLLGWPYREKNYWHFVFNLTPEQAKGDTLTTEGVEQWIRERTGQKNLKVYNPTWISKFRIHNRKVSKYRINRVMVIGDAAHLHSPMAGKGLGNSAQEAFNLGWKLAAVVQGKAPESILDTVEQERLPVLRSVTTESETSHLMFVGRTPLYRTIRNHALPYLLNLNPLVKQVATNNAQLNIHYRKSPLSVQHTNNASSDWKKGPQAGERAPEAMLSKPDSTPVRLHQALHDPRWTLLLFSDHLEKTQSSALQKTIQPYASSIQTLTLGSEGNMRDSQGQATKRYRPKGASVYLVRPDGYIGFRSETADPTKLAEYLRKVLLPDPHATPFIPVLPQHAEERVSL
ncbi:MAG: FAD-dependent monooxygenase [Trueperaceae bacterium]